MEQANALKKAINRREKSGLARWLLLRNRAKLSEKQDVKLQELLAGRSTAGDGVRAEEGLKGIWYAPSVWEGWRRWRRWMRQVKKRASAAATIWSKFIEIYAGDPGECKLPDAQGVCWKG